MMQAEQLLTDINLQIDELILCQRQEQDMILQRRTAELPALTMKIGHLTLQVKEKQEQLDRLLQGRALPGEMAALGTTYKSKFHLLQELTLQNHLLLENSLTFLKQVFEQVFGRGPVAETYDERGISPLQLGQSGGLIEVQI